MSRSIDSTSALSASMIRDGYLTDGVTPAASRQYLLRAKLIGQRTGQSTTEVMDEAVALASCD